MFKKSIKRTKKLIKVYSQKKYLKEINDINSYASIFYNLANNYSLLKEIKYSIKNYKICMNILKDDVLELYDRKLYLICQINYYIHLYQYDRMQFKCVIDKLSTLIITLDIMANDKYYKQILITALINKGAIFNDEKEYKLAILEYKKAEKKMFPLDTYYDLTQFIHNRLNISNIYLKIQPEQVEKSIDELINNIDENSIYQNDYQTKEYLAFAYLYKAQSFKILSKDDKYSINLNIYINKMLKIIQYLSDINIFLAKDKYFILNNDIDITHINNNNQKELLNISKKLNII